MLVEEAVVVAEDAEDTDHENGTSRGKGAWKSIKAPHAATCVYCIVTTYAKRVLQQFQDKFLAQQAPSNGEADHAAA